MRSPNPLGGEILRRTQKWHRRQVTWRRHLHRYPELSNEEHKTSAYLRKELKRLGLRLLPLRMKTGVLAELRGVSSGPTVAIRADIDALPVLEQTGLPYASRIKGRMHACGHDMHMATVLGTAAVLAEMRGDVRGRVRFLFQPAEETPPGGARPMIQEGAIDDVAVILGLHVDPGLAVGKIGLCDGPTMAAVYDFDLMIHGKGGHVALPHSSVDAIATAAEVVESVQKIISRETDPNWPATITFGRIEGGTARNVVADHVRLTGTARTLSTRSPVQIPRLIRRTVAGVCRARGAGFEIKEVASYPMLVNDPGTNRLLSRNYEALFGKNKAVEAEPVLGGEDFSCYLRRVPGAWARLGIRNRKIGADKPWHSPDFIADERALFHGTALLVASTIDYLSEHVR